MGLVSKIYLRRFSRKFLSGDGGVVCLSALVYLSENPTSFPESPSLSLAAPGCLLERASKLPNTRLFSASSFPRHKPWFSRCSQGTTRRRTPCSRHSSTKTYHSCRCIAVPLGPCHAAYHPWSQKLSSSEASSPTSCGRALDSSRARRVPPYLKPLHGLVFTWLAIRHE